MTTLFLADFTVFFVVNTTSFSFYFPFPDLHIYSFTLPEVAMTANLMVCFLTHHQATQLFSLASELQVPDFKMRQWSLWDNNRKDCREGGPRTCWIGSSQILLPGNQLILPCLSPSTNDIACLFFFLLLPTNPIFAELTSVKNGSCEGICSHQQEHGLRVVLELWTQIFPAFLNTCKSF